MKVRTVIVVSDASFFRSYTWDRGDEMVNDHPEAVIRRSASYVTMSHPGGEVRYRRIASADALRGMTGPVELIWQADYQPRGAQMIPEYVRIINATSPAAPATEEETNRAER